MRIVFAGTPEVAVPTLHALVEAGHEILGVLTREDAPIGRKRVLTPSPVATAAEMLRLPVLKANTLGDEATAWVEQFAPDLGVVVAYGGLIREPLLSLPVHGWINLHFSDLPRWRGAAPVQRALMAGEQRLGLNVFRLVAELDAGRVLTRDACEIEPGTSAGEALQLLAEQGPASVLRAIELLAEDPLAGEPQQGAISYAHKLTRADGKLDPAQSAAAVLARWAGVTPEPGAYLEHDVAAVKVLALREATESDGAPLEPGEARIVEGEARLGTGTGALVLERVQPAGKGAMDGAAWLRGRGGEAWLS